LNMSTPHCKALPRDRSWSRRRCRLVQRPGSLVRLKKCGVLNDMRMLILRVLKRSLARVGEPRTTRAVAPKASILWRLVVSRVYGYEYRNRFYVSSITPLGLTPRGKTTPPDAVREGALW
jgi:hypothetical protein